NEALSTTTLSPQLTRFLMHTAKRFNPALEQLEDRLVPTFNATYSATTATWTITQTANSGDLTVIVNAANPPATQMQVIDGANTVSLGAAGSGLAVNLVPGTSNLNVQLDTGLTGNLTINLASGNRSLNLTGASNTVNGNLSVTATTGDQNVQLSTN